MAKHPVATSVVLAVVVAASAGAAAAGLLMPRPLPESAGEVAETRSVEVILAPYDDARSVRLRPKWADSRPIRVGASGVLTSLECEPGAVWKAGEVRLSVNDRNRILLHTARPMWRDLWGGERGKDVESLQSLLSDAGHDVGTEGSYDKVTRESWRQYLRDHGIATNSTAFLLEDVIPLGETEFVVSDCKARQGDAVTSATDIATSETGLASLALVAVPGGMIEGERILRLGETEAPASVEGSLLDDAGLALFAADPLVQVARDLPAEAAEVQATLALATPLDTAAIPPSALFGMAGAAACVADGERTYPVEIVASSLGLTHVTFPAEAPGRVDIDVPEGQTCG